MAPVVPAAQPVPADEPAGRRAAGDLGLFAGELFLTMPGGEADGLAPPAGLWTFRDEWIAVPAPGVPATGREEEAGTPARAQPTPATLTDPAAAGGSPLPPLVWLRAPELIEGAQLVGEDRLRLADGSLVGFSVVPAIPTNELYVDGTTSRFLAGRPLRLRGWWEAEGSPPGRRFVAATAWPEDARIPWRDLELAPLVEPESLADLVRAQAPEWPAARLLWERGAGEPREWAGAPVLAIVLSGAQGDAPGSHAGHIAVATGRLGPDGGWADWLANNIYPIDVVGDKGILSGPVPMDNYLADLNSGQAMYRPVTVLVLVLREPQAPAAVQGAFQRFFLDYWCRRVEFDRASHNSTQMSVDTLRQVGWELPEVGGTSWLKGLVAAAGALVVAQSFELAGDAWSFFTEERTHLFPRVAFEQAVADLLAIVGPEPPPVTAFEERLREDAEAILFLRFPQIPSSRPFGTYPVDSVREYRARVGLSQAGFGGDDPTPRPFPDRLRQDCRQSR